jgi:hypothetical protein
MLAICLVILLLAVFMDVLFTAIVTVGHKSANFHESTAVEIA